jgi:ethanolamine utilization protein EutN
MTIGRVTGALWCTKKGEGLSGYPLLLVEPEGDGAPFAAADTVGAGPGERVLVVRGGAAGLPPGPPVDARIIGIVDGIEVWPWNAEGEKGERKCPFMRESSI